MHPNYFESFDYRAKDEKPYMLFNGEGSSRAIDSGVYDGGVSQLVNKLKTDLKLEIGTYEIITIRDGSCYKRQFRIATREMPTYVEWN